MAEWFTLTSLSMCPDCMTLIAMEVVLYFPEKSSSYIYTHTHIYVYIYIYAHCRAAALRNCCSNSELVVLLSYTNIQMKMKNPIFNSWGFIMFGQEKGQDFFANSKKSFNVFSLEQSRAFSRAPGMSWWRKSFGMDFCSAFPWRR